MRHRSVEGAGCGNDRSELENPVGKRLSIPPRAIADLRKFRLSVRNVVRALLWRMVSVLTPPVHVPADGGESVFLVGDTYTTLLSGTQTGGVFTLLEALVLPEAGPPPHAHHGEEETFFLLQGHMVFTVAGETYHAHPGATIYVPRNVAHSYRNVGESPAKMVFMYSPAGMDAMF